MCGDLRWKLVIVQRLGMVLTTNITRMIILRFDNDFALRLVQRTTTDQSHTRKHKNKLTPTKT
jgi:hypothetical protein